MKLSFVLNGQPCTLDVQDDALFLDVVREMGLTGTKEGCGVGVCGACTVLVGDDAVSSCLLLAGCVEGSEVWTIEGIAEHDPALVQAFVACEGMQCGICTPGQMVAAAALHRAGVPADEPAVRAAMAGNLCRCTGYGTIVEAVMRYLG